MNSFVKKIKKLWLKLRLCPIRVFCLHYICDGFEPYMHKCDYTNSTVFREAVLKLLIQGYTFISLNDVEQHLKKDFLRKKKYISITFDDGYKSIKEIVAWLSEQNIPITLFINGKYTDGISFRSTIEEKYLTLDELKEIKLKYPTVSIQSHGWEHTDALKITSEEFVDSVCRNNHLIIEEGLESQVKYFAYTWGNCSNATDKYLSDVNIIPVKMDGRKNYTYKGYISREEWKEI